MKSKLLLATIIVASIYDGMVVSIAGHCLEILGHLAIFEGINENPAILWSS